VIVDTSALFAYFVRTDPAHSRVRDMFEREAASGTEFVVSPYVIAELDYLVATRFGVGAETAVLRELSGGAWSLASLNSSDLASIAGVVAQYADQQIGATDASLVVLADQQRTRRIATLDSRHFTVLRALDGEPFELLP
jgi:uncharacterized protein